MASKAISTAMHLEGTVPRRVLTPEERKRRRMERERARLARIKNLPWWKRHSAIVREIFR